jgi:hypothetical protein
MIGTALDYHLNADPHRVSVGCNAGADEREGGGEEKTGPGEKQKHSGDDCTPMRNEEDECVTSDRNQVEGDESAPVSPPVG